MKRKPKYRKRYRLGEAAYRALTRKEPVNLSELSTAERLAILFGQRRGVAELVKAADGDLLNLVGMDVADLEAIPGVGPALAAKVAVFLYEAGLIHRRLKQRQDATSAGA